MCGIVGFVDPAVSARSDAVPVLERMRKALFHRGPDDSGDYFTPGVGLGIQRLSIVDIEAGGQPFQSDNGKIVVVFNGEIYNHADLRAELNSQGRGFRTRCDTEVVLAQYERYGLDGIRQLNGMFGVAILDIEQNKLHLVRDRLGVKPLYYGVSDNKFYFASEIKALLASEAFAATPNPLAVWDFMTFRYVPTPQTIWNEMFKLPPAHRLSFDLSSRSFEIERYWDIPYATSSFIHPDASNTSFESLFEDAVNVRMLADVPVGVFLSGGLDSSAIVSAIDRNRHNDVKTFSVAMEDAGSDDERAYARIVADHLGTDHHEVIVSESEFVSFLERLPFHTDEPLADATCVPLHFLAKKAREEVKVVLSGEGADEILGGYTFDAVLKSWEKMASDSHSTLEAVADQRVAEVPLHITDFLSSTEKRDLFSREYRDSRGILQHDLRSLRENHPLHQSLYLYCQNWLVEDLLMKADKMTMAASLELRTPFLDFRLVEWSALNPPHTKVRRQHDGSYVTKAALREYAKASLPASIIDRQKKGFPVPIYGWLSNRLKPFVMDTLCGDSLKSALWFNQSEVRKFVEQGTREDASMMARHHVWHLLVLELWSRAWLK